MGAERVVARRDRKSERTEFVRMMKRNIRRHERRFAERNNLFRVLLTLADHQLASHGVGLNVGIKSTELTDIPLSERVEVLDIFDHILEDIHTFKWSGHEGEALLAKLLEWSATEIARSYYPALRDGERDWLHHPIE